MEEFDQERKDSKPGVRPSEKQLEQRLLREIGKTLTKMRRGGLGWLDER